MATATRSGPGLKGDGLRDFSGGPNLRDTPPELAKNELPDDMNVTFDERGGAASRKGYAKRNGTPFGAGLVINEFWSQVLGKWVTQAGKSLYLDDTNTIRQTFSTTDTVTFTELNSLVIACHPADGIYTSPDGITYTKVADADAPTKPTCCEVWQNKLFVGDATGTVHWSNVGDPTAWTATDFNKLWEKDQQ